ncbi:MAG: hypothetical protein K9J25_09630 [Bacteroidales bacterium]|nr:hypothetical protein [Bacteroidales bacterium]
MKKIFAAFLVCSIILNLIYFYKLKQKSMQYRNCVSKEIIASSNLNCVINSQITYFKFENKTFSGKKSIIDSLRYYIKNSPKLFLSFNENSCESCITQALNEIVRIGSVIGGKNIIILTKYKNENEAIYLSKRLNDRFIVFNITSEEQLYVDDLYLQPPCFFIMDDDLTINCFFLYSLNQSILNEEYINAVKNLFPVSN